MKKGIFFKEEMSLSAISCYFISQMHVLNALLTLAIYFCVYMEVNHNGWKDRYISTERERIRATVREIYVWQSAGFVIWEGKKVFQNISFTREKLKQTLL